MRARILLILDGAPEPVGTGPTSLEAARTPALDLLCAEGAVGRVATTPPGTEPGSETGVPVLLGAAPRGRVARGPLEAAAAEIPVPAGHGAWRLDLRRPGGARAGEDEARAALDGLRAALPRHRVLALRGHRALAVGPGRPAVARCGALAVTVWPDGAGLEPVLAHRRVTLVCGPGAVAGIGRLLGARVEVPRGATGDVDSDFAAKAAVALAALERGDEVVVHAGAPDEAAHRREPEAKRAALERIDAELIAPLRAAARAAGVSLAVTADHATCPRTGRHDAGPVPCVVAGPRVAARGPDRLTERAAAPHPPLPALALALAGAAA